MIHKLLLFLVLNLLFFQAIGQTNEVSLVVSSKGTTEEEAKTNALRSAIEQAFGTFVSSRTEILNDDLVQDQIVSVSNGNIKKFEILSSLFLPDQNLHLITLNATVSLDKLTSFVQSKGYNDVSFDGGGFAMNLKIQNLNASAEIVAIKNVLEQGLTLSGSFFDRELKVGNPKIEPANRVSIPKYQIPLTVHSNLNSNWYGYHNFYAKTLKSIAMSREEAKSYKDLNKIVYQYVFVNRSVIEEENYDPGSGKRSTSKKNIYKSTDTLTFRTQDALTYLTSFNILLNSKYLDEVTIVHELDTMNVELKYNSEYRIGARSDNRWIDYTPNNLWFIEDLPFNAATDLETFVRNEQVYEPIFVRGKRVGEKAIGMKATKVISRPLIELRTYIQPIFSFTNANGQRLESYEAFTDSSALGMAINSTNLSSLQIISDLINTGGMPLGFSYFSWSGRDFRTRVFEVRDPDETVYSIKINAAFTEQELGQIRGFKLVN
jgi:hypothetical protein